MVLFVALVLAGCGTTDKPVTPAPEQTPPVGVSVGDYKLGSPLQAGNVTVVPVLYTKDVQRSGDEITLAEAKKLGLVEIIEIPGQEEVNRLRVHNKSDRPLLLLGGELLLGGKQDRIVMHDVIIPPGETQDVDVNCVEHGRWTGSTKHFDYSGKMVPNRVREAAAYEDQEKVWDDVAGYNAAASPSMADQGTTVQIGLNSPEVEKKIKDALPELSKGLAANEKIVGVIFVLNGEIVSMDLFGNPKTFQSAKEGLLTSYLSEGAIAKSESKPLPADADFKSFLEESLNGKRDDRGQGRYMISDGTIRGNEIKAKAGIDIVHGSYSKQGGK